MVLRSLGLLALLFSLPIRLSAQCDYRAVASAQFRSTALDLQLEGDDLWAATSYGLALYDRRDVEPRLLSSIPLNGATTKVRVNNRVAYVASGSTIFVVRRELPLRVVRQVEAGGLVNDLLLAAPYLYAATTTGIVQFDLLSPESPVVANRLSTSTGSANSLARAGAELYAADGDASVEVYSIAVAALPQRVGSFNSLPRSLYVHALPTRLLVSDGQQSEIFTGAGASATRTASLPTIGAASFFPLSGESAWLAGADRRLRALDLTDAARPVVLFESGVPSSSGSVNRIVALTGFPGRLYAAAGDSGIVTYTTENFKSPFALRATLGGATTSIVSTDSEVFAALESGGIRRFSQDGSGIIFQRSEWDLTRRSIVHDVSSSRLLTSAAAQATVWDLNMIQPAALATINFRSSVTSAILLGANVIAVLEDRSIWSASVSGGAPGQLQIADMKTRFVARAGNAVVLVDLLDDGSTTLRYFASGDLAAAPAITRLEGSATSGVSLNSAGLAAVSTFRGISLVTLSTGATRLLTNSNRFLVRDLQLTDNTLAVAGTERVQIFDLASATLLKEFNLPSEARSIHASATGNVLSLATADGVTSILLKATGTQPAIAHSLDSNRFYTETALGNGNFFAVDGRAIDAYTTGGSGLTSKTRITTSATIVDIATAGSDVVALSTSGRLLRFSADGTAKGELQLEEGAGSDLVALDLFSAGKTLFASISRGCLSGNCEKRTLVIDARDSMRQISSLPGGMVDAVARGARLYALFDLPAEIRIYDLSGGTPALVLSRAVDEASTVRRLPVSVAYDSARSLLFTVGETVLAYSEASLTKVSESLTPYSFDPTGRTSFVDQKIRVDGNCAVIAGRAFDPQLYMIGASGALSFVRSLAGPSAVRSLESVPGTQYFITEHSIEQWTTDPFVAPVRKRGARP